MNKKIIAAAIAAVVAAPAVSAADTTLYGKAHMSIQSNNSDANGDNYTVDSNSSRLGVKGSEDLGNGLKAIFQMEMDYNMDDNGGSAAATVGGRDSFVGLSGDWGTLIAGRHDTPAKMAIYSTGIEVIGDAVGQMINNDYGLADNRVDNAIAYVSPSFSGFTFAGAVVPGEAGATVAGRNRADSLADGYSLGLMYGGGGLKASLGYEVLTQDLLFNNSAPATTQDDDEMWQAGLSYTFGDFMVGGVYEDHSAAGGLNGNDFQTWGLMGKATFGNNVVTLNYTNQDFDLPSTTVVGTTLVSNGGDNYGIQLGHNFSKRSMVYAAYEAHDRDANNTDTSQFALGMIHKF